MQYPLIPRLVEDVSTSLNNSNIRMSWFSETSTKAQMGKIMDQYGRPSGSSPKESVRSSCSRTKPILRQAIWWSSFGTRLGKVPNWRMFTCQPSKTTILICVCGRYQIGRQEWKHRTNSEEFSWKTLTWENQHHFPTIKIWVVLEECQISKVNVAKRTSEICSNPGFLLDLKKTTDQTFMETWGRHFLFMDSWHGRSCMQRNAWKRLRICK